MLGDLAFLTGGSVIAEDTGLSLANADLSVLGRARKVVVTRQNTAITDGAGDFEQIRGRANQIYAELDTVQSSEQREILRNRLGSIVGGVAIIRIGGLTEAESLERRRLIERAILSTRVAIDEGLVPGAGTTYLLIRKQLTDKGGRSGDNMPGQAIVLEALSEPLRQIARNAGYNEQDLADITAISKPGYGLDVASREYVDLAEAGLLDPAGVIRRAIIHAAHLASRFVMLG